jgi:hypothetical protein
MPKTEKGEKIYNAMKREYGSEKGKKVFYASRNKGTITGVDACSSFMDACSKGDAIGIKHCSDQMARGRVVR